jgi:hypothetical protein
LMKESNVVVGDNSVIVAREMVIRFGDGGRMLPIPWMQYLGSIVSTEHLRS